MLLPRPHTIPPCGEVHPEFSHSGGVFSVSWTADRQQCSVDLAVTFPGSPQSPRQAPPAPSQAFLCSRRGQDGGS